MIDSIDSYINNLLLSSQAETDSVTEVDIDDVFEGIVEEYHSLVSNDENNTALLSKYLVFVINELKYIVDIRQVITVKRLYNHQCFDDYDVVNVNNILGSSKASEAEQQYAVFLRGETNYVIAADSIGSLLEFGVNDFLFYKPSYNRPWIHGITIDYRYLVLDSHALCNALSKQEITA